MLTDLSTTHENLAHILTWQETRTLSKNLTIQFKKVIYQVQTKRPSYALRNAHVTVCEDALGTVIILYKGKELEHTLFHEQQHQSDIVETKNLDLALQNQPTPSRSPSAKTYTPLQIIPGESRSIPKRGHLYFGIKGTFLLWVDQQNT